MKIFQVIKPGFFTTIQDIGRFGFLRYGVPISGAMDTYSLIAANVLVGNKANAAALETTIINPELKALTKTSIAITGGNAAPKINGEPAKMWQTITIDEGDVLSFGKMENGCHSYIAVRGGIDVPVILGSRSTFVRGGFGGLNGRQLKSEDFIESFNVQPLEASYRLPENLVPKFGQKINVHVIMGPQEDMFTENGIQTFLSSEYKVTPEADRMGYRLEGPQIERKYETDIISDALLPGSIQVPRSGKPIVVMRDAQTTGGYPKIAVAASADLWKLGQAKPNDIIEFSEITLQEAHKKLRQHLELLNNLSRMLKSS